MRQYVAFLRGMNVGGRRIKNPELCACFTAMGFDQVAAFLASGNVIFHSALARPDEVAEKIEQGLEDSLGYAVPTFVRTASEVNAIVARQPFAGEGGAARGKQQVAMLARKPPRAAVGTVLGLATDEDWLAVHGRELFWWPQGTMSDSTLPLADIEKALGPMTVRTRRTIERLAARYLV